MNTGETSQTGLLLVGHGTREPQGQAEFHELTRRVAALAPEFRVAGSFLELAEPTIAEGVAQLLAGGAGRIIVAPQLLFAAGHAKRDIPAAVEQALGNSPIAHCQLGHFGCRGELLELSAERFRQSLIARTDVPTDRTTLVLMGRGSTDAAATREMQQFAALRAQLTPVGRQETCFFAMAAPRLEETLATVARDADIVARDADIVAREAGAPRRIVVQPHLLFRGELLTRMAATVALFAAAHPQHEWIVAEHLGPDEAIARMIVAMARAAVL